MPRDSRTPYSPNGHDAPMPMGIARFLKTSSVLHGRFLAYLVGLPGAVLIDRVTPNGVADWLIEVILVWIASVAGGAREMTVVAALGSMTMVLGIFSAPATIVPFWMGTLNRFVAIVAMWTMVNVARSRLSAEEAQRKAVAQIKILQGLLPICASCKAIKSTAGEWQSLEAYLAANSEAQLTHGLCPGCAKRFMDELDAHIPRS